MLWASSNQICVFFLLLVSGGLSYLICKLLQLLLTKFNSKITTFFYDLLYPVMLSTIFFIACLHTNYGKIRLYLIIAFIFGYYFASKIFTLIVAIISKKRYNKIVSKISK